MKSFTMLLATAFACLAAVPAANAAPPSNPPTVKINMPSAGSFAKTLPSLTFSVTGDAQTKTCSLTGPGGYYVVDEACKSPFRPGDVTLDGSYTYAVDVRNADDMGDVESVTFEVDQTPPTVMFTSAPPEGLYANATTVGFKASYADPNVNAVTCRFDSDAPIPCGVAGSAQMNWTGFGEGAHKMSISVTDKAGNVGYAERNITIDRTPPTASLTLVGGGTESADNTPAFIVDGTDAGGPTTKRCAVENQIEWVSCNSSTWVTPDAIADGVVTAWLEVEDRAGNHGYSSYTFTLDATIPAVEIGSLVGDRTTEPSPALSFSVDDVHPGEARCGFDPSDWSELATCDPAGSQQPASPLAPGTHAFWVEAIDTFGNSASAIYTFEVAPPTVPDGGGSGGGPNVGGASGVSPKVLVKLRTGSVKRGKFALRATLVISTQTAVDCTGRASILLKPTGKKARVKRLRVTLKQRGKTCSGAIKTRLGAGLKRKKVAISVTHPGNRELPKFTLVVGTTRL